MRVPSIPALDGNHVFPEVSLVFKSLQTLGRPIIRVNMIGSLNVMSWHFDPPSKTHILNPKMEVDGSDVFPFPRCDFQVPAVKFRGSI